MIPEVLRKHCLTLQDHLQELRSQIEAETTASANLQSAFAQINQTLQAQLQLPEIQTCEASLHQQIQTIHTELNKQVRLLSVDLTFLQGAKQAATRQQRQTQVKGRLDQIQGYCAALLEIAAK